MARNTAFSGFGGCEARPFFEYTIIALGGCMNLSRCSSSPALSLFLFPPHPTPPPYHKDAVDVHMTISCHVMSYHAVLYKYHVIPNRIIPYHINSYHTIMISHRIIIISCHVISHHVSYHIVSSHITYHTIESCRTQRSAVRDT